MGSLDTITFSRSLSLHLLYSSSIPEGIGKQIEKECQGIYPLQNVFIRKVKVLKAPKFDAYKLLEAHGEAPHQEDTGSKV